MTETIPLLRSAISNNHKIELLANNAPTQDIATATTLVLHNSKDEQQQYNLNDLTNYRIDDKPLPLRAIYNAFLHKDSSVADYISDSQLKKIETINFKNKNDLINYLQGNTDVLHALAGGAATGAAGVTSGTATGASSVSETPLRGTPGADASIASTVAPIQSQAATAALINPAEAPLLHENFFQGEKLINFNYLIKDAQLKIINQLKSDMKKSASSNNAHKVGKPPGGVPPKSRKNESPIILLSPSTSALLQMQNAKDFLEYGTFKEPATQSLTSASSTLLIIKKNLAHLGPQKFLIVNSTEFFTKQDYWNRVVAIFTTGQPWQFKGYPIKDPEKLFQKHKGYHIAYEGDMINKNVQNWNVEVIKIDRNRRFNDKEISEYFWASLEKAMIAKGFPRRA